MTPCFISRKVYISKNYRHLRSGGDKAKTDVESIISRLGWINIGLSQGRHDNAATAYFHTLYSMIRGVASLRKGDLLLLQYPLKKYFDFVVDRARRKDAFILVLIHDLGSFRRKRLTVKEEIQRLNKASALMVHTSEMKRWLIEHGITIPVFEVGLWDYLTHAITPVSGNPGSSSEPRIAYAGELSPRSNSFICRLAALQPDLKLFLYGKNPSEQFDADNISYQGFHDPETLVSHLKGNYGLVWYGSSLTEVDGPIGEYLPYCASHKTSLYLRAGMPVIIWDKAALARTVTDMGVGIAVPSLENLAAMLRDITPDRYREMSSKAREAGRLIAEGHNLGVALEEVQRRLKG